MKSKKRLANIIMAAIIIVIVVCGIFIVGRQRGWFSKSESGTVAVAMNISGNAQLTRDGIAYPIGEDTDLRDGDEISSLKNASLTIEIDSASVDLTEQTDIKIESADSQSFEAVFSKGEIFVCAPEGICLSFMLDDQEITVEDAVISLSYRTGSQTLYVYSGEVTYAGAIATAGKSILYTGGETFLSYFDATVLDEFCITKAEAATEAFTLCFTYEEFAQILSDREAQKTAALEEALKLDEEKSDEETDDESESTLSVADASESQDAENADTEGTMTDKTDESTSSGNSSSNSSSSDSSSSSAVASSDSSSGNFSSGSSSSGSSSGNFSSGSSSSGSSSGNSSSGSSSSGSSSSGGFTAGGSSSESSSSKETESSKETTSSAKTCTIEIRCDTILNNMKDLTSGKEAYVPSNGIILATTKAEFTEGETVFEVLKRVCSAAGIQIEYSWTPMYGSYYIEGINNLYEFDCGSLSGWMYKVNGWFPNYGCSSYTLSDGDVIVWCYTCDLGKDVGDQYWDTH